MSLLRWQFIKENKKVRKKERKHALDQDSDQVNDQEKGKFLDLKNINQFYFQPLIIIFVICWFYQIEEVKQNV